MKTPRPVGHIFVATLVASGLLLGSLRCVAAAAMVERWGVFEVELRGPAEGNPFREVSLGAEFSQGDRSVQVDGFYDGDGVYRVRFMPDETGEWRYRTRSNRAELADQTGTFTVEPATTGNHGPVRVANTFHFAYADGTPFKPVGTTCYTWTHRPEALEAQTLRTLAMSPFNKLRMCVFPQTHGTKTLPPPRFPFAGPATAPDYERFNPEFFRHLERRVGELRALGIECDLILFHPYDDRDAWKLKHMPPEVEERYLRYSVARLAAFRNVWWSLANEYDFIRTKSEAEWDRNFQTLQTADPYGHLRSIHNGKRIYNHNQPWVTHASIQNGSAVADPGRAVLYRDVYRKPIVYDEVEYEGASDRRWAQLSGRELVHRCWAGAVAGTYVGHSEVLPAAGDPDEVIWLGQGGVLRGESPARIAFLRRVLEDGPAVGIEPVDKWWNATIGGQAGAYYLVYFGHDAPTSWAFALPRDGVADGTEFAAEVIDTWEMTVTPVSGVFVTKKKDRYSFVDVAGRSVELPGKPGIALRIRRVAGRAQGVEAEPPAD
ncbi:MAG: DUF5060 domain-containing protein [Opitutaceae bacterium]